MNIKETAWYPLYQLIWEQTWVKVQYAISEFNFRNDWQTCLKMIDKRRFSNL
jgi:hypothetical protein